MGQFGTFKEYQFTGSYSPLYDLTNPPPGQSLIMLSGSSYTGSVWQELYFVTSSWFVALSGSIQGNVQNICWPTNTKLVGKFTAVRLTSGSIVLASQGKNYSGTT